MKFKQQEEETPQKNSFFDSIMDLIIVSKQFLYGINSYKKDGSLAITFVKSNIESNCKDLFKLAIALSPEHKSPTMTVDYVPANSKEDLIELEERYYNMLKEIANNALEKNNAEVFSYLSPMIKGFDHYFCTLDEDDDSRETSS